MRLMLWLITAVPKPAKPLTPPPRRQRLSTPKLSAAEPDEAPGTVLGSAALVAGTTVGAGILALPAKTLAAGLAPTATLLVGGWAFMAATGLLIAEVDLNTACVLDRDAVSINSMAEETLGDAGATAASAVFLFLHFCLLTAYVVQGGQLLGEALGGTDTLAAAPAFAASIGAPAALLRPATVERLNTLLTAGVVASFCYIVAGGITRVDPELLTRADWSAITPALPVIPVVYVYQTVVPTLCYRLQCDLDSVRRAVLVGLTIPLCMFLAWSVVVLGSTPYVAGDSVDPLVIARASGDDFGTAILYFSLLAVGTSLLGFATGLVDFFGDLLGLDGDDRPPYLWAAALAPPAAIAAVFGNPSLFFAAVDLAGVYGILVLFGVVPALMAWGSRYGTDALEADEAAPEAVPGGRASLGAIAGFAAAIIGLETYGRLGVG